MWVLLGVLFSLLVDRPEAGLVLCIALCTSDNPRTSGGAITDFARSFEEPLKADTSITSQLQYTYTG